MLAANFGGVNRLRAVQILYATGTAEGFSALGNPATPALPLPVMSATIRNITDALMRKAGGERRRLFGVHLRLGDHCKNS